MNKQFTDKQVWILIQKTIITTTVFHEFRSLTHSHHPGSDIRLYDRYVIFNQHRFYCF